VIANPYSQYTYNFEMAVSSPYWRRNPELDAVMVSEDDLPEDDLPLYHGPQVEDLEARAQEETSSSSASFQSLVGEWSGSYTYGSTEYGDGLVEFGILSHSEEGTIHGSGVDAVGAFSIKGSLSGERLQFAKDYVEHNFGWHYEGTYDPEVDKIAGRWGHPEDPWVSQSDKPEEQEESQRYARNFHGSRP
jgi:hypothetical protein